MNVKLNIARMPDEIYFCRHAQSVGNARGMDDDSLIDIPNHSFGLSEAGIVQAQVAASWLRGHNKAFDEHYVSTFTRTHETFSLLFGDTITPYEDPRLDEWWKGIFHAMSPEERARFYPAEQAILDCEGWYHYRPPQGESRKDVELRILSFLSVLSSCKRIFICGHGRWENSFERLLCGLPRESTQTKVVSNASIVRYTKKQHSYQREPLITP